AVTATRAPSAAPSCTATVPTPPDPPCTSSHSPDASRPTSTRLFHAVHTASGSAAASTRSTPSGTGSTWVARTRTCSAYPPPSSSATTRSPVDHPVTASPTAAIVPDTSRPGQSGAPGGGGYEPARCSRSARFTPAEATCTTTSSGPGVWSGSVETVSFSGPPGPDIVTPRTSPRLRGRPGGAGSPTGAP